MKALKLIAIGVFGWAIGYFCRPSTPIKPSKTVVLTRVDTIRITTPEIIVVSAKKPITERLAVANDTCDSVEVVVPIEQKVYSDENYRAYISGFNARLDSIDIFQRTTTITNIRQAKQSRFSIGINAGYGITPKGSQPYIGVGVTFKLF